MTGRVLFALIAAFELVNAANNCDGTPNNNPIWTGQQTFIRAVPNGQLYKAGPENQSIYVMHLYGTPFEWGVAHGQLLKSEITSLFQSFPKWVESQADQYLKFLPLEMRHAVEQFGMNAALDMTADLTRKFTPQRYFDEMEGLANATGVEYKQVVRFEMFTELIKAACTIMGAWGKATPDGGLIQLRLLDFGIDNPMRAYQVLTVYHPNAGDGHTFAIQTFAGFIGAITGYSGHAGISEKVWIHSNETKLEGRAGFPWMYMLRDILQYDNTIADAVKRMTNVQRTCSIFVGVGTSQDNECRVVEYSDTQLRVFAPNTPFPGYAPTPVEHPLFEDLVYVDKHTQPSRDPCTAALITSMYGNITPARVIRDFAGVVQSGDLQAAVYDFKNNFIYISFATPSETPPTQNAFDRQFLAFNMTAVFAVSNH